MSEPVTPKDTTGFASHVFGPVLSRRLGRSLGIDPLDKKRCNWNCVYCQLGRSGPGMIPRDEFVPLQELLAEVELRLSEMAPGTLDWVTIVASGETLLYSRMGQLIEGVKKMTSVPVAVITNGSLLSRREVREELLTADAVLPSLDVGTAELFRLVNRPHPSISFQDHLDGLKAFREIFPGKVLLEVMLIEGLNDSNEALTETAERIREVQPDEVHISLPDRPPAEPWVSPPDAEGIDRALRILGSASTVLRSGDVVLTLGDSEKVVESLISVIARHPLSEGQVMNALASYPTNKKSQILVDLEASGRVKRVLRNGGWSWVLISARFPDGEQE